MTTPVEIKAVVFDMDGVLFDTEPLYEEAAMVACAELGWMMPSGSIERRVGLSWVGMRTLLAETFGPTFPIDRFVVVWLARFEELTAARLRIKPGVHALVRRLDALKIPRAIATGAHRATVRRHLSMHAMEASFQAIVAHEDCIIGKPAPDPFLAAAALLGVEPANCLVIEDSYNGVRSAAAAGMMTVMVPDTVPATDEMRDLCVQVCRDLDEVSTLFLPARP